MVMALAKALAVMVALAFGGAAQADTLQRDGTFAAVRSRGVLVCGVNAGLAGFAIPDGQGIGPASTSICAARSRPRSSTTQAR